MTLFLACVLTEASWLATGLRTGCTFSTGNVANALATVEAAVEKRIARLTARDARSATGHVLDNMLLTVTHLVGEVDARRAWLLLVAVVWHLWMSTAGRWTNAGKVASHLRATGNGWFQHRPTAMADELLKAGLKARRASATMARHRTIMESTSERLGARDRTLVQACGIHSLQLGQRGALLRLVLGLKVERAALAVALVLAAVSQRLAHGSTKDLLATFELFLLALVTSAALLGLTAAAGSRDRDLTRRTRSQMAD